MDEAVPRFVKYFLSSEKSCKEKDNNDDKKKRDLYAEGLKGVQN